MKLKIILPLLLVTIMAYSQNVINLTYNAGAVAGSRLTKNPTTDAMATAFNPAAQITVNVTGFAGAVAISPSFNGTPKAVAANTIAALTAADIAAYSTYNININCGGEAVTFTNVARPAGGATHLPTNSAVQELNRLFTFNLADHGLEVVTTILPGYLYTGSNFTHIFLDQFGNTIFGAIPQGISNRQYIVDIIYLANSADPSQITYSVKQTKGSFNPALVFNNAGAIGDFTVHGVTGPAAPTVNYVWATQAFPLRISTDNIEFSVSRNVITGTTPLALQSTPVTTLTIEMAKIYHGSFDVGLINTELSNPTYELLPSIADPNQTVVKRNNYGSRGVVTVMATFYTSPVLLFKRYVMQDTSIPNYKLYGRNFLDDHKLIERIFPVIGVSVTDKSFKNLFYGLNWEIARGLSAFAGFHYAEVNTFSTANGFEFETTVVNEAEFNLRQNKKWKQDFAFGVNLDLLVVTNLFKK